MEYGYARCSINAEYITSKGKKVKNQIVMKLPERSIEKL